jgi:hypothetical protein
MSTPEDPKNADERFERAASRLLREGTGEIDAATASRLNRARQLALSELDRGPPGAPFLGRRWQPAVGLAAVALLAIVLWRVPEDESPARKPALAVQAPDAADLDVILSDESLDLIANLEFYEWAPDAADPETL